MLSMNGQNGNSGVLVVTGNGSLGSPLGSGSSQCANNNSTNNLLVTSISGSTIHHHHSAAGNMLAARSNSGGNGGHSVNIVSGHHFGQITPLGPSHHSLNHQHGPNTNYREHGAMLSITPTTTSSLPTVVTEMSH